MVDEWLKMYINMDKTPCYNLYFSDKIINGVFNMQFVWINIFLKYNI